MIATCNSVQRGRLACSLTVAWPSPHLLLFLVPGNMEHSNRRHQCTTAPGADQLHQQLLYRHVFKKVNGSAEDVFADVREIAQRQHYLGCGGIAETKEMMAKNHASTLESLFGARPTLSRLTVIPTVFKDEAAMDVFPPEETVSLDRLKELVEDIRLEMISSSQSNRSGSQTIDVDRGSGGSTTSPPQALPLSKAHSITTTSMTGMWVCSLCQRKFRIKSAADMHNTSRHSDSATITWIDATSATSEERDGPKAIDGSCEVVEKTKISNGFVKPKRMSNTPRPIELPALPPKPSDFYAAVLAQQKSKRRQQKHHVSASSRLLSFEEAMVCVARCGVLPKVWRRSTIRQASSEQISSTQQSCTVNSVYFPPASSVASPHALFFEARAKKTPLAARVLKRSSTSPGEMTQTLDLDKQFVLDTCSPEYSMGNLDACATVNKVVIVGRLVSAESSTDQTIERNNKLLSAPTPVVSSGYDTRLRIRGDGVPRPVLQMHLATDIEEGVAEPTSAVIVVRVDFSPGPCSLNNPNNVGMECNKQAQEEQLATLRRHLEKLTEGALIHVTGRLRMYRKVTEVGAAADNHSRARVHWQLPVVVAEPRDVRVVRKPTKIAETAQASTDTRQLKLVCY